MQAQPQQDRSLTNSKHSTRNQQSRLSYQETQKSQLLPATAADSQTCFPVQPQRHTNGLVSCLLVAMWLEAREKAFSVIAFN